MNSGTMYVLLESGGKQRHARVSDVIRVERLPTPVGGEVTFGRVLAVGEEASGALEVGTPVVAGVQVRGTVLSHGREARIRIFKMKRRKNYRRRAGHRQQHTAVRITAIEREES